MIDENGRCTHCGKQIIKVKSVEKTNEEFIKKNIKVKIKEGKGKI